MKPEDARGRLEAAVETLKAIDLPEPLEVVAFERLLDAYGLPRFDPTQIDEGTEPASVALALREDDGSSEESTLAVMAKRLHSDLQSVGQIYDVQDGDLQLILRRDMLPEPSKKAISMRHVALLVAAGRQAAGLEDWTPTSKLRDECREIGVLDPSNFSTEIGKLGFKLRGAGVKRDVRVTRHHLSEASDLVAQILKDAS